jgi:hypothetical protein
MGRSDGEIRARTGTFGLRPRDPQSCGMTPAAISARAVANRTTSSVKQGQVVGATTRRGSPCRDRRLLPRHADDAVAQHPHRPPGPGPCGRLLATATWPGRSAWRKAVPDPGRPQSESAGSTIRGCQGCVAGESSNERGRVSRSVRPTSTKTGSPTSDPKRFSTARCYVQPDSANPQAPGRQ